MEALNNNDGVENISGECALKQLTNIQFIIGVKTRELLQIRNLQVNDFTLNESRKLEEMLIKHFSQQLAVKERVDSNFFLPDLDQYPSLLDLLNVVGVSSSLIKSLQSQKKSVEDLLQLTNLQLQLIVSEANGISDDSRKLISALALLKVQKDDKHDLYNDVNSKTSKTSDIVNLNIPKLKKSNVNTICNGIDGQYGDDSRNGSESSNLFFEENPLKSRIRSKSGQLETVEVPHNNRTPSSYSSCVTPPSPMRGSRSSLEDSAFFKIQQGSPPPRINMVITPTASNASSTFQTPPVTPGTPQKNPNRITCSSTSNEFLSMSKSHPRTRVSSTGAKSTYSTLLPPFNKLKSSKSTEWQFSNQIAHPDNVTSSSYSLSAVSSLPHHSSAPKNTTKAPKKNKKRPGNLVLDDKNVPNYINISRTATRRSSATISLEGARINNTSPLSPGTPMTPKTPFNLELLAREQDIKFSMQQSPKTPKTPKSFLKTPKTIRKFFKLRKIKLPRSRSTEEILDEPLPPKNLQSPRRSSDTRPATDKTLLRPLTTSKNVNAMVEPLSMSMSRQNTLANTEKTVVPGEDNRVKANDDPLTQVPNNVSLSNIDTTLAKDDDEAETRISNLFRQPSMMNSEEWDIPFDQLEFVEKIGSGRVGTVYKGYWHGDVAIREITVGLNDEEKLRAFKQKVQIYKITRHENVELFMGSCMDPPRLAIVTGYCRGSSLYNFIRKNKGQTLNFNSSKIIAQHIVQGMGYLHSKGIIHKDLKSKNIFVDGKRVVITDFGLVGLHAVLDSKTSCNSKKLAIPDGWLCYLAPEVIKSLRCPASNNDDVISTLPYTVNSDVYAFGTVWYELLSRSWPFEGYCAESIIYAVGSGKKQNLSQLQCGKDAKDLLVQCWSFSPSRRPDFSDNGIMGILNKLQTQIQRTLSSHPRRHAGGNRGVPRELRFDSPPLPHASFSPMHELPE